MHKSNCVRCLFVRGRNLIRVSFTVLNSGAVYFEGNARRKRRKEAGVKARESNVVGRVGFGSGHTVETWVVRKTIYGMLGVAGRCRRHITIIHFVNSAHLHNGFHVGTYQK